MTYLPPVVAPPAPLPWDLPAITAAALDVLRLDPTDQDADRVTDAATEITMRIDEHLDWETSPWPDSASIPAPVVGAAVQATVTQYRRKDSPNGTIDSWTADGAQIFLPRDPLAGVRAMLTPYRSRWGVG